MLQLPDVIVNAGLVQSPWDCIGPTSTCVWAAAVVVVDDVGEVEPAAVVEVVEEEWAPDFPLELAVVVVEPEAPAVVVVELEAPPGGGRL